MLIKELLNYLENLFPLSSQADFDNCGLQIGDIEAKINSVLICLDVTEDVIDEAKSLNANLIISHHPLLFKSLKKISKNSEVERIIFKAIKDDIAIYSLHTNLDHSFYGVNRKISEILNLENVEILSKNSGDLFKLAVYTPIEKVKQVENAMFIHGAGSIGNYNECSFVSNGVGSYKPELNSNPYIGEKEIRNFVDEQKIEVLVSKHKLKSVVKAMIEAHPYEEVAYDIYKIENQNITEGSGMIGELKNEVDSFTFLSNLKQIFHSSCIKYTELINKKIKKVAFCGGAGIFLLSDAIKQNADIFITGDVKYHDFFMAERKIIIADIGHYESEQFTIDLIYDILLKKNTNFAIHLTKINTNPVNYL